MSFLSFQSKEEEEAGYSRLKDLPKATMLVFSRLPFVCITLGACLESFVIAVVGAFLPKIIETQFHQPPGKAALLYGLIAVPCALVGNMLGEFRLSLQTYRYLSRDITFAVNI